MSHFVLSQVSELDLFTPGREAGRLREPLGSGDAGEKPTPGREHVLRCVAEVRVDDAIESEIQTHVERLQQVAGDHRDGQGQSVALVGAVGRRHLQVEVKGFGGEVEEEEADDDADEGHVDAQTDGVPLRASVAPQRVVHARSRRVQGLDELHVAVAENTDRQEEAQDGPQVEERLSEGLVGFESSHIKNQEGVRGVTLDLGDLPGPELRQVNQRPEYAAQDNGAQRVSLDEVLLTPNGMDHNVVPVDRHDNSYPSARFDKHVLKVMSVQSEKQR